MEPLHGQDTCNNYNDERDICYDDNPSSEFV